VILALYRYPFVPSNSLAAWYESELHVEAGVSASSASGSLRRRAGRGARKAAGAGAKGTAPQRGVETARHPPVQT
jgi:hypothetical protein